MVGRFESGDECGIGCWEMEARSMEEEGQRKRDVVVRV
jgi:hypothetical protein